MATFTDAQFQTLMAAMLNPTNTETANPPPRNDPSALGPIRQCLMGSQKMLKLTLFEEWLEEAESRMQYIGTVDDKSKIILLKSWGGTELVDFMKTHIKTELDNYEATVTTIKEELRKLVNRTMAMYDLLTTKQGSQGWMDFIHNLEKKAKILNFNQHPYTIQDAVKDAAIFGMTDTRLREKALADDPNLETLTRWGQAREAGKEDASNLKDNASGSIKRIGWAEEKEWSEMNQEELDTVISSLQVMKLKKIGKYSNRYKKNEGSSCNRCLTDHSQGRCPAYGKECFTCGEKNHFSRAAICKGRTAKRVQSEEIETT